MLKIYNTFSQKKEIFKPRKDKIVELFVCGPTTYDFPHIGHAKTYVSFDVIVRFLRERGYDVFYLQNITDIDDKIIKRAKEKKTSWKKIARYFEKIYLKEMKELKVESVTKYARATDHIKEIISQVERLLKKGFAYQIEDGIYYDIKKFKHYGKLAKRTVQQAEDGVSRIDEGKNKKNKGDFCLWKFSKPGEPKWKSPWGYGRPGWHIEDTAITEKFFGPQYDIHGGGKDLIFPHHEAEIAQMEGISGKRPMVKYWMHVGFVTVKGKKMSKSLGNFITIKDFIKKHSPRILRYLILKTHYRSPLDYKEEIILQVKRELERIDNFVEKIKLIQRKGNFSTQNFNLSPYKTRFQKAMEDDFNTPQAIGVIFEIINQGNILMEDDLLTPKDAKNILEFFEEIDKIFCFIFWKEKTKKIPKEILKLVKERERERAKKNWEKADKIREEIIKKGWWIEDTKEGPRLKKL